ncbi:MAG: aryl-sulfate sulfotransferase, partial [Rhodobacteraceae bacterium]|nr:aryl-sulfate sulfotransferase [Paracoccaceae bacterium]
AAFNGYTLFAPMTSNNTYLIDNCGEKIHDWNSAYRPGLSTYLLDDGTLLRTRNTNNSTFNVGGSGGGIELLDWNGNVVWEYTLSTTTECQHHDVEYLPDGNILAVVWDSKTATEANQAGRVSSGTTLWSEKIIEIAPNLAAGGGTIVWEWKAWDHLVQDVDNTKDNFGNISSSPELINVNFTSGNPTNEDWLHINSVDYNEELDQIVLSSHGFSEIWIIDHSTTTAQAASHLGGTHNKGGDLLYRWGNPQTYGQGANTDQLLYKQHDAYWIADSLTDGGMLMVFNNQAGNPSNYSEVNVINPPIDANGGYSYSGGAYAPSNFHWSYQAPTTTDFYASNISGAQRLPNGNTLICDGPAGTFFEVDYNGNTVWEYINPVTQSGILTQGDAPTQNIVFRSYRYPKNHPGLINQTLTPQGYIENGSTFDCSLHPTSISQNILKTSILAYPNPAQNSLTIEALTNIKSVTIFNATGLKIIEKQIGNNKTTLQTESLEEGIYFIQITLQNGTISFKKVVITK